MTVLLYDLELFAVFRKALTALNQWCRPRETMVGPNARHPPFCSELWDCSNAPMSDQPATRQVYRKILGRNSLPLLGFSDF